MFIFALNLEDLQPFYELLLFGDGQCEIRQHVEGDGNEKAKERKGLL